MSKVSKNAISGSTVLGRRPDARPTPIYKMAHETEGGLVPWAGSSPYPLEASFFQFWPTVFFDKVFSLLF